MGLVGIQHQSTGSSGRERALGTFITGKDLTCDGSLIGKSLTYIGNTTGAGEDRGPGGDAAAVNGPPAAANGHAPAAADRPVPTARVRVAAAAALGAAAVRGPELGRCMGLPHLSPTCCTKCSAVVAASISVRARGAPLSCSSRTVLLTTYTAINRAPIGQKRQGCW